MNLGKKKTLTGEPQLAEVDLHMFLSLPVP